ncbi:MAG: 6-carboxytetrahydropterin synthase QueD [Spirochaetia bacterium]|nr:6-carboxytetrahydropterin synthase QueD [Spirochaetia bacterium]
MSQENLSGKTREVEIVKKYGFEAAHLLTKVPPYHKCSRLHGHSFKFEVRLKGTVDAELGWLIDFGDITSVVKPLLDILDHNYLNEIEGLENPTSEMIAMWLWDRIKPALPDLMEITVHETCSARCSYRG